MLLKNCKFQEEIRVMHVCIYICIYTHTHFFRIYILYLCIFMHVYYVCGGSFNRMHFTVVIEASFGCTVKNPQNT